VSTKRKILTLIIELVVIVNVTFLIYSIIDASINNKINSTIIKKQRPLQLKIDKLQLEIKRMKK